MMTPRILHYGTAEKIRHLSQSVLDQAYIAHLERFDHCAPKTLKLPTQVWVNKPKTTDENPR
jgi:putative transposase